MVFDNDHVALSAGMGWRLNEKWTFDFMAGVIPSAHRDVSADEAMVLPGRYETGGFVFILGVSTPSTSGSSSGPVDGQVEHGIEAVLEHAAVADDGDGDRLVRKNLQRAVEAGGGERGGYAVEKDEARAGQHDPGDGK